MNEKTQTEFKTEGQPAFLVADTGNDNPAESSTVDPKEDPKETNTDPTQSPEGEENTGAENTQGGEEEKKPLHENPRWEEREKDWKERFNKQEKRQADEIQKLRDEFGGDPETKNHSTPTEVPSWFGGDENDWKEFQSYNQGLVDKATENIKSQTQKESDAQQKAIDDATDYMKTEISDIQADKNLNPDGVKIDQNKLLKFVLDNELVDTKGRWNYRVGHKLMMAGVKSAKNATIKEKKDIAGASITEKNGAEADKSVHTTSEDFKNPANRPW